MTQWECAARKQGSAGGNIPADCDWPYCGCDEHAAKAVETMIECGWIGPQEIARKDEAYLTLSEECGAFIASNGALSSENIELRKKLGAALIRSEKLARCLGFFASVIKSGEPWTDTCEREYRAAREGEAS